MSDIIKHIELFKMSDSEEVKDDEKVLTKAVQYTNL